MEPVSRTNVIFPGTFFLEKGKKVLYWYGVAVHGFGCWNKGTSLSIDSCAESFTGVCGDAGSADDDTGKCSCE